MQRTQSFDNLKSELERTQLRLKTIWNDYNRDDTTTKTILGIDSCDLIYYAHTPIGVTWDLMTTRQRISSNYFQNETYPLVMLPYHAYEFIKYIYGLLEKLNEIASGKRSLSEILSSSPSLVNFFKNFHRGNFDEACKIWKNEILNNIVSIASEGNQHAMTLIGNPLKKCINLIDNKRILSISDLLGIELNPELVDYSTYNDVYKNLLSDPTRYDYLSNNDIDALAAGLTKGLNNAQGEYFFSLSTLAKAPLSAYSRSFKDERTSICRNTCVSSYRTNIVNLHSENKNIRMKYVEGSISTIRLLLDRFDSLRSTISMDDLSLAESQSSKKMTSLGLLGEYYNDVYKKIVEPVRSDVSKESPNNNYPQFVEIMSDEDKVIDEFNEAIKNVVDDAKEFVENLKKYASSHGDIQVAGTKIEKEISKILMNIEDIGKVSKKR